MIGLARRRPGYAERKCPDMDCQGKASPASPSRHSMVCLLLRQLYTIPTHRNTLGYTPKLDPTPLPPCIANAAACGTGVPRYQLAPAGQADRHQRHRTVIDSGVTQTKGSKFTSQLNLGSLVKYNGQSTIKFTPFTTVPLSFPRSGRHMAFAHRRGFCPDLAPAFSFTDQVGAV